MSAQALAVEGLTHTKENKQATRRLYEALATQPSLERDETPGSRPNRGLTNGSGPSPVGRGRKDRTGARGRRGRTNGGFTNGSGRTNGSGFTNGSGRTNGSGFTNGSGRTNGSGFTNGSGRAKGSGFTNGSGRTNGGRFVSGRWVRRGRISRERRRRRSTAVGSVAILLALTAFGALGLVGQAANAARIDGRFGEWAGRTVPVATNPAGLASVGLQPLQGSEEMFLSFSSSPFETRADVWVFLDRDGDARTGYFDGSLGAEAAVQVAGEGGRVASSSVFSFLSSDRLDIGTRVRGGSAQAASDGALVELTIPFVPRAFSVARVGTASAVSTGALSPSGVPLALEAPALSTSGLVRNGIRIDADFSDWSGVARTADPQESTLPARLDLAATAAVGDGASAEFYLNTRGDILSGTIPLRAEPLKASGGGSGSPPSPPRRVSGTDLLEVYLDTDLDAQTGAPLGAIGADLLLRVEGMSGVVVACSLYAFGASGWTAMASPAEAASSGQELEAAVEAPGLVGARARFQLSGFEGLADTNDQPVVVGRQAGALAPDPTAATTPPQSRGSALLNPIPEFAQVAAPAAGLALLTMMVGRRRRRTAAGANGLD